MKRQKTVEVYTCDCCGAEIDDKANASITSYFSELLNGRKSISLSILFSIAEETGVDIHELVIEVGE